MTRRNPASRRRCFVRRYKTALCQTFVTTGACPFGFDCLFAHDESELRTEEMNVRERVSESVIAMWVARKKREVARPPQSHRSTTASHDSTQGSCDHSMLKAVSDSMRTSSQGHAALRRLWQAADVDGRALERVLRQQARSQDVPRAPRHDPYTKASDTIVVPAEND